MTIRDLIKRNDNGNPFMELQRDMNQLFEGFWRGDDDWAKMSTGSFVPSVEVTETDRKVEVTAELPGMSEKDIEITLQRDNDIVVLKGEKRFEEEKKEKNYYRSERRYGAFQRAIPLPTYVDADGAEATFKSGVLHLSLPKSPSEKHGAKKIKVKAV